MEKLIVAVSKKVEGKDGKGEYEEVGKINIFYPLLSEFGVAAEFAKDEKTGEPKKDDDGLPLYAEEKAQYLFDCVIASVKAAARNKLISGTATVKEGAKIAETLEELIAPSTGNRGEALAIAREVLAKFKAFLATTGKNQAAQDTIYLYASNKPALALASATRKEKFLGYVAEFIAKLSPEEVSKYERPLKAWEETAKTATASEEDF